LEAVFKISTIEELHQPAQFILNQTENYPVVIFNAEMGAGKTTLIAEICKLLAVTNSSSPTYSIVNTYFSKIKGEFYHLDLYRLKDEIEALDSGIEEILDSQKLCFIEWPEKIDNLLPNKFVRVGIKVKNNLRKITVST